jgi:hypothetical protein
MVKAPTPEEEDRRRLCRERKVLTNEIGPADGKEEPEGGTRRDHDRRRMNGFAVPARVRRSTAEAAGVAVWVFPATPASRLSGGQC